MKHFPVVIVALVILAVSTCVILLFIPTLLPEALLGELGYQSDSGKGNRIGLAQLFIESASLAALLLAAWEFHQAQRKPKLRLWMDQLRNDERVGEPTQTHTVAHEYTSQPEKGRILEFPFLLLLENYGSSAGRWIKVALEVRSGLPPVSVVGPDHAYLKPSAKDYGVGKWLLDDKGRDTQRCVFHANDSFIAYEHPNRVENLREWMDELGHFVLVIPVRHGEDTSKLPVEIICSVQADNFPKEIQKFKFREILAQ